MIGKRTTTTRLVISSVERLLDLGYTDKNKIIAETVENLGIPRPTVRRIIRDMRKEMQEKIRILQADHIPPPE